MLFFTFSLVFFFNAYSQDTAESFSPDSVFGSRPALVQIGAGRAVNGVMVNGCSPDATFQTVNVTKQMEGFLRKSKKKRGPQPSSPSAQSCDKELEMNKGLVDFVNRNMENCIRDGWNAHISSRPELANNTMGKIRVFHEGCMGDHKHQKTPSWHNHGLAWDVAGIEVGGTPLWFVDGQNVAFYEAFRQCWGEAVKAYNPSCSTKTGAGRGRAGKPAGTIGKEDKKHQNHLHISLPCKHLLKNPKQRMYMAGGRK